MRNASIIRAMMMEAVLTSKTSVHFNVTTRRYFPEDTKLYFYSVTQLVNINLKVKVKQTHTYWVAHVTCVAHTL
jgi:hypothetical protein